MTKITTHIIPAGTDSPLLLPMFRARDMPTQGYGEGEA